MIKKNIAISFNEDITVLSDEIKEGSILTGYFYVFSLKTKDGDEFYIANNNYDSPLNLLGMVELEQDALKDTIKTELAIGKSSAEIKLLPSIPPNSDKEK